MDEELNLLLYFGRCSPQATFGFLYAPRSSGVVMSVRGVH
jgi:hypothetical protein